MPRLLRRAKGTGRPSCCGAGAYPPQTSSNPPYFTKVVPARDSKPARLDFTGLKPGSYRLTVDRVGLHANDAYTAYLEMGSPPQLSAAQLSRLEAETRDLPETARRVTAGPDGTAELTVAKRENDVVLAVIEPES